MPLLTDPSIRGEALEAEIATRREVGIAIVYRAQR
jgi:hypothetical protein